MPSGDREPRRIGPLSAGTLQPHASGSHFRRRRLRQSHQDRQSQDGHHRDHGAWDHDPARSLRQDLGDIGGEAAKDGGGRRRSERQAADAPFAGELFGGRYGADRADCARDTSTAAQSASDGEPPAIR